jgi:hypothetical protein
MTKARSHGLPHRARNVDLPASDVTAGKYAYTPGVPRSVLEVGHRPRVEPQVTESLLREFLTLLEAAQEELNQRWNGHASSGCHADRS